MLILIPLGGIGDRFKKNSYNLPKALINILGKPIIYYLLENLNIKENTTIYIPYNMEYNNYRFEDRLIKDFPNLKFKFLCLHKNTDGAADTINIALNNIKDENDQEVICLDGDNFYSTDIIDEWNGENKIFTFNDMGQNPIYSYVDIDENNIVKNIVEKEKISNNACTGAYGFNSFKKLLEYTELILKKNKKQKGEYYTSGIIKEMIDNNIKFKNNPINIKDYICLGTPLQIIKFYNNYPKVSCKNNNIKIKPLRICFDLDNTLVTFPKIKNDYTTVKPINSNIEYLRYLKKLGNTIIIYTARKMKSTNGNIGKIMSIVGKITFDTLDKFDIPYDEIYFGKPYADFYIDDLAVNCFDNINKIMGFYPDKIDTRKFNSIEHNSINILKKKSQDLSGEIHYYLNIPKELKDLFPIFIEHDDIDFKWYKMEKIDGVSCTTYFLSELMDITMLKNIMNTIKRLQDTMCNNTLDLNSDNINIYENYAKKIKNRYESYDYSKFDNSEQIYTEIYNFLVDYEKKNRGKKTIIHGDPVFTNIIINNYDKIKLIDMRGKNGDSLSIYGDWLYDWSKMYQSIIGYDKILQGKSISIK